MQAKPAIVSNALACLKRTTSWLHHQDPRTDTETHGKQTPLSVRRACSIKSQLPSPAWLVVQACQYGNSLSPLWTGKHDRRLDLVESRGSINSHRTAFHWRHTIPSLTTSNAPGIKHLFCFPASLLFPYQHHTIAFKKTSQASPHPTLYTH